MASVIVSLFLLLALIHVYHNGRIQPHSLFLSGAIIAIAVVFVNYYLFIYGPSAFWLAFFFGHFTSLHLLVGPFLFFYVRGVLSDRRRILRTDLLHFVPSLLDLLSRIPYFRVPWETKLRMAGEMIRDVGRLHDFIGYFYPPPSVALTLRLLSMIGYTIFCLWMVGRFVRMRPSGKHDFALETGPVVRFLKYLLGVCLVAELSFFILQLTFFGSRDVTAGQIMSNPLMLLTFLGIVSIPVIILLYPEVLYGIPRRLQRMDHADEAVAPTTDGVELKHRASSNGGTGHEALNNTERMERFRELARRIEQTLTEQKPYLNPDFSLDDLSRLMDVPKHHIYYCLNEVLRKKFTQLRAEYRIRHALHLMEEGQTREKTLEAIGMESGFATRGTFISTFRELTGMTPGDYQRTVEAGEIG